ncbi:hypothetical protein PIB30_099209 [Stylosanthes scabra]|uniref:Alpha/beta hydrolase fold-3 domain-containing protein n=1 Tax=Stylosanthes scabra TaxID=79078 RepID=A0ABU6TZ94_9FABA|nr:hypothetical protein [Stylosanthes scabra]
MPTVAVKLYSVFFKFLLKQRLQNRIQESDPFGVTSRPGESVAAANPSFTDGVATKDIHIDTFTSLSVRIFLPESALSEPEASRASKPKHLKSMTDSTNKLAQPASGLIRAETVALASRRVAMSPREEPRRNSLGPTGEGLSSASGGGGYLGYSPAPVGRRRKLPVIVQFHGGGWVSGSGDSVANDVFCRRIAKLCDAIVVAVGYRLAPENKYPAAFEDGLKVLHWLAKQANLAECSRSTEVRKLDAHKTIVDSFGAAVVEPWLAAHANPSRFLSFFLEVMSLILLL